MGSDRAEGQTIQNHPVDRLRGRGGKRRASVVILDADDRQGSALYWSERRDDENVMVKDSSVAGLPLHVSRGRSSGKIDIIIIDTPANSKDIAMLAAKQADFVIIPVAPRCLNVQSVLQTVKQVQQAGTPFAVILTQVSHQGGKGQEAHAGFTAKEVTMFDSHLHYRKDFYKATPLGRTAVETEPDSKAAAELQSAYAEAKQISGFATKQVSEVA